MHRDPVCGRRMNPNKAYANVRYEGSTYLLCCPLCQETFESDPERYAVADRRDAGGQGATRPEKLHQGRRRHRSLSD